MTNYISSLEELYNHPDNGKDDIFLAAFLSADGTYPIFVTRIYKSDHYRMCCIGYKWGYNSSDKMIFDIYDDASLRREVSQQFFTWHELPQPVPLATQAKCHFLPLQPWNVSFGRGDYEDRDWRFSGVTYAVSRDHARFLVAKNVDTAIDIYASSQPVTFPAFWEEAD